MNIDVERSLWRCVKRHGDLLVANVAMSLVAAAAEGLGIGLLAPVLQGLVGADDPVRLPLVAPLLGDESVGPRELLLRACALVLIAVAVRCLAGYGSSVTATALQTAVGHDVRMRLYRQMVAVDPSFFTRSRAGSLINIVTTELFRVELLVATFTGTVLYLAIAGGYVVVLLAVSPILAALAIAVSASTFGVLGLITKRVRAAGRGRSLAMDAMVAAYAETVAASRTIRLFAREEAEIDRFDELSSITVSRTRRELNRQSVVAPLNQIASATAMVALIVIGFTEFVAKGRLAGTTLLVFFFGLYRLAPCFQQLSGFLATYAANRVGLERIDELLEIEGPHLAGDSTETIGRLQTAIELVGVDFSYTGVPVLRDITLRVERGRTTALVGRSGSGKSTIADLIVRLIDPDVGEVRWDGVDLRTVHPADLRRRIGVVSQETFMFHTSIRDNVSYGRPGATDAEVWSALEQAGAAEFVRSMAEGLDTLIGERGASVSGGQRQRLAIARALLVDPDVLIFDEATSALDPSMERDVLATLRRLGGDRTVILIAHRLSTVEHADVVVVLEDGVIADLGPYEQLRQTSASFARVHGIGLIDDAEP